MRTAALWRNKSFGSQSQAGSFFVSIMLTLVTSLRSQNCSVLDYLFDACHGARNGHLPLYLLAAAALHEHFCKN
jgi:transposase